MTSKTRTDRSSPHARAWAAFLRAHSVLIGRLEGELAQEEALPLTWFDVLIQLHKAGGSLRMGQLADRLVLSRSGITRLIDRMAAEGLVKRRACPTDRRVSFAVLTDKGAERLDAATPVHARGIREHFARHLTRQEAAQLAVLLDKVLRGARGGEAPAGHGGDGSVTRTVRERGSASA